MNSNQFRKELIKVMPGYKWTVHNSHILAAQGVISATGIQSSGFNRLSTLSVIRREIHGSIGSRYEVKSSGFGTKDPWIEIRTDGTLRRALRGLQNLYEAKAQMYSGAASDLKYARKKE